jgi:hypothetical protein
MAGPALTQHLAGQDYDTFRWMIRHLGHDTANRLSGMTTQCSIVVRVLEKIPYEEVFTSEEAARHAHPLMVESQALVESLAKSREYLWPPENTDEINRERWKPYDAGAWDRFVGEYELYVKHKLETAIPIVNRLFILELTGGIRAEGKGKVLLMARGIFADALYNIGRMFHPEIWDEMLPEWIHRQQQHADVLSPNQ